MKKLFGKIFIPPATDEMTEEIGIRKGQLYAPKGSDPPSYYQHFIQIYRPSTKDVYIYVTVITQSATELTHDDLVELLGGEETGSIMATGWYLDSGTSRPIITLSNNAGTMKADYVKGTSVSSVTLNKNYFTIEDEPHEI